MVEPQTEGQGPRYSGVIAWPKYRTRQAKPADPRIAALSPSRTLFAAPSIIAWVQGPGASAEIGDPALRGGVHNATHTPCGPRVSDALRRKAERYGALCADDHPRYCPGSLPCSNADTMRDPQVGQDPSPITGGTVTKTWGSVPGTPM